MRSAWIAVLWGVVWALVGCDRGGPSPAPVTPGGGVRVAVLSPAAAIILRDIGAPGAIVGRHQWDMVLDQAIPVCGDQNRIDLEALIAAGPTHVVTQWGSRDLPEPFLRLAAQRGWKVHDARLLSLEDIRREVGELSAFLGMPPDGSGAHMALRLDQAWSPRAGVDLSRAGRVLLLGAVSPPGALGPGSCHHQVLTRMGGTPAIETGGAWLELDTEDLLALAPEVIVAVLPGAPRGPPRQGPFDTGEAALARLPALRGLAVPAVRSGRVVIIDDPLALTPSTHMAAFADQLAEVLGPWCAGR